MNKLAPTEEMDRPGVVAFGGGKGGTGRSTICAEVARSMARHGHRILCIDASWDAPTLNTLLHAEEPVLDLDEAPAIGEEDSHIADLIRETASRHIWMASVATGRRYPFVRPKVSADVLIDQACALDFDWVFFDLPPGIDPLSVGLFLLSDVPVLVSSPEPAAIRMAAQYMRGTLYQAIGYHPEAFELEDELLQLLYAQSLKMNRDSLLRTAPSADARRVVIETFEGFEPYIIVNMVREGAERDLGFVMAHALHEELGVFPRYLGSVDYEDRRWFFNRRTAGLSQSRGEEALSADIEGLAKHITDLSLIDKKYPRPVPRGPDVHPALKIGLAPETGRNEIRQHCRRLWEGYRREASIALVFADPEERDRIADQLEATYRKVLTLPSDSYSSFVGTDDRQKTTSPSNPSPSNPSPSNPSPPAEEEQVEEAGPTEPTVRRPADTPPQGEEITADAETYDIDPERLADGESPGRVIEKLRRDQKMSLQELSLRTHIGIKYLAAIEDADLEFLPRPVYLRGYLREIARIFDIEAQPLIDEYFRFLGRP